MPAASTPLTLSILQAAKASQLKHLAQLSGVTVVAQTKNILGERLWTSLQNETFPPILRPHQTEASGLQVPAARKGSRLRVLSIDMGIRNLAYCVLEAAADTPQQYPIADSNQLRTDYHLRAWERVELLPADAPPEAFSPARLAPLVVARIMRPLILDLPPERQPHAVLLERQRWRSGGGAAVQQWTLRVNSVEAMLWGALASQIGREGASVWNPTSQVPTESIDHRHLCAVDPAMVSRWLGPRKGEAPGSPPGSSHEADMGSTRRRKVRKASSKESSAGLSKDEKVSLVAKLLKVRGNASNGARQGPASSFQHADLRMLSGAEATAERFLFSFMAKGERKVSKGTEKAREALKEKKLDDLADCLLQGLVWLNWQHNRRQILLSGKRILDSL